MSDQLALPGLAGPRRRGPAQWYRHMPHKAAWGEGRGPHRVMGVPARWWEGYMAEAMARFLALEFEVGERVAARLAGAGVR